MTPPAPIGLLDCHSRAGETRIRYLPGEHPSLVDHAVRYEIAVDPATVTNPKNFLR